MTIVTALRGAFALGCAIPLLGVQAFAQDEPQTFNAFAIAVANGTIVKSAEKQVMVVGTIAGPMFIETDEGPVGAGRMTCAASVRVDLDSQHQAASGACTFIAEDGATAWGDWECTGYALVGCHGKLTLHGGSQRLAGITGEGAMVWRPSAHEFAKQLDGTTLQNTSGVVVWRDFKIAKSK